jgi:hypothetical protein
MGITSLAASRPALPSAVVLARAPLLVLVRVEAPALVVVEVRDE